MYARLRSKQALPSPIRSDPPQQPKASKKHRLFGSEDRDSVIRQSTPKGKKPTYHSIAPIFEKYKKPRIDEDDRRFYPHRQRLSPSPDPEPPLATEVSERYADLRVTLHSAAIAGLEEVEAELTATAETDIRNNQQKLATLEAQVDKLVAPLRDLTITYTVTGKDGRKRDVDVAISEAVIAFDAKLKDTTAELEGLWAS